MIELGEQQKEGLNYVFDFINSNKVAFSLTGYAGTGKSLLTQYIVKYLEENNKNYVLCAPTHKAKLILERFTERSAYTLHKLLSLSPNIEIINLDFRDLRFSVNQKLDSFPTNGYVICDESSMVNDPLFDLMEERAIKYNSKIIFVGDIGQIMPVNNGKISKVFNLEDNFTLTKIYRQLDGSGLSEVLIKSREQIIPHFDDSVGENGSLLCYNNPKDFFIEAIPYFKKSIEEQDILECKFYSYTNKRADSLNSKMKEILFGDKQEYYKGEMISCFDNLTFNSYDYSNSMEYFITKEPVKIDINIPGFIALPGYRLSLYDSSMNSENDILIISNKVDNKYLTSLAMYIDDIRVKAIRAKQRKDFWGAKKYWKMYYQVIGSFTTPKDLIFDERLVRKKSFIGGYATTFHRSQGSSINNTFLDMSSIYICRDKEEMRQLQYVGLSRSRNNVHILQK